MADFGTPVAENANPVGQGMQTLSQVMNLQQQRQGLQLGQQSLQVGANQAQQAQQAQAERQRVTQMMTSGKDDHGQSILGADGTPDPAKLLPVLGRIAPLTGQDYAQKILKTQTDNVGLKAASTALDANQRAMLMGPVQAAALDPNTKSADVNQGIDNLVSAHPEMTNAANYLKGLIEHFDNVLPDKRAAAVQHIAATMQGGQGVQTQPSAASVQTGTQQIQGTIAPPAAGGGFTPATSVQNQVPPGAQIITDTYGRQFVFNPKDNSVRRVTSDGFAQPVPGQQQILQDIDNARAVGDQAPAIRNVNQQLLQLSNETKTGPGTQNVQKIAAFLGMPSGSQYQEIGAYLDRQAAMQARFLGVPNTNAGLAASERATGTTQYTPQALQEKVKFADALNSGTMAYRQGLDKAVGTGAAPDLSKYQAFRSAWAQNFDPDVFRAEDAQRRGDTAELAAIKTRIGQKGMASLAQKSANLRQLENGQIPQ